MSGDGRTQDHSFTSNPFTTQYSHVTSYAGSQGHTSTSAYEKDGYQPSGSSSGSTTSFGGGPSNSEGSGSNQRVQPFSTSPIGYTLSTGFGEGMGVSSSPYTAAPGSFQADSSYPSESFYARAGGPPGFEPPQINPQVQPRETFCEYELPVVLQSTGYASDVPADRRRMKYCQNPALSRTNPPRCIAHEGKYQFRYECQAKVYALDANGQVLWNENVPVVEPEYTETGGIREKICKNPVVSEKFFCAVCRPKFFPCSFGLAFPDNPEVCSIFAQPDEPWLEWANCWAHHGNPNKPHEYTSPGGNYGWPENREKLATNPAPTGHSKKSGKTGQRRGQYQSGRGYETVTRGVNDEGYIVENPPQDAQRKREQRRQTRKKEEEERNRAAEASREMLSRATDNLQSLERHSHMHRKHR